MGNIPIKDKAMLTIKEASEYSNIGIHTLESMVGKPNCPFVLYVGTKRLIKRKKFEEYLDKTVEITR